MLNNIGIRARLLAGFVFVLLLLSSSLCIYHFALGSTIDRYERLISREMPAGSFALETDKIKEGAGARETTALLIGLSGAAAALLLALCLAKSIKQPLEEAVSFLERAADGDLSEKPRPFGNDDFARLFKALDNLSTNLDTRSRDMSETINALMTSSTELAAISVEMTRDAGSTSEKITAAADAAD